MTAEGGSCAHRSSWVVGVKDGKLHTVCTLCGAEWFP